MVVAASLPLPPPSAVPLGTAFLTWPLLELEKPAGASDPRTWGWKREHMVGAPLFQKGTLRPTREDAFLLSKG